jgi:hypothetical protein
VTIYQYKLNIKNLTYKIIDGTKYIDVKNKVINDDATLLTYDNVILKEYNNRLINLKFDINAYIVNYFYDRIDKKIEELQKEISSKYEIKVVKEVAEKF